MTTMRAKMKITTITQYETSEQLILSAVTNGSAEDNNYSKYTPNAELKITITNEALRGKFNAGETYYVDFTKAE